MTTHQISCKIKEGDEVSIWKVIIERFKIISSETPEEMRQQAICAIRELCKVLKKTSDIPVEAAIEIKNQLDFIEGIYSEVSGDIREVLDSIENQLSEKKVYPVGSVINEAFLRIVVP